MSYARTLVKLSSFQIVAGADTIPYSTENVPYATDATVGTTVKAALDALFAAIYPNTQPAVDYVSDLPPAGNTLNDYRIVLDDGDGKAAGYRWERREGDLAPSWYKVHDMDWSSDAILTALQDKAFDLYVSKYGREDLDADGNPITGPLAGQQVYGGALPGSNLTLHANAGDSTDAPEDQTGYIQNAGHARPLYDDAFDLGTLTERFRDLLLSGVIGDGSVDVTVQELYEAHQHSQVTSQNPHDTSYDQLATRLGDLTIDGDANGVVDLSASGDATLTLTIEDDSHSHDAASTITGFDSATYEYLKAALVDNAELTWIFDDVEETIEATVEITTGTIDDVGAPATDKILVGNPAGTEWIASSGLIELTGGATGSATYDSATDKWSIVTSVASSSLAGISEIELENKTFTSVNDVVTAPAHGLQTGEWVTLYGPNLLGPFAVTVLTANTFQISNAYVGTDSGYYIPVGGQLLWDPMIGKFKVAKEYEEIRLGELAGLSEDVLAQYVAVGGRPTGQTIKGGVSAGEKLILESTAHATKGTIEFKDSITPFTDAVYSAGWTGTDVGSTSKRINDLYMAGELKGSRIENVVALPTPSGTQVGRPVFYNGSLYLNTGAAYVKAGSSDIAVVTKTADYTAVPADDVILVNAASGGVAITLPSAASSTKLIRIKKTDSTSNTVVIDPPGTQTIDGALTCVIYDQYQSVTLVSDGSNWSIV